MASKPETTFTNSINKLLPRDLHREKMNNPFRSGTFDYWYSGGKGDIWIEYKYTPHIPRSEKILPDLSPRQKDWGRRRHLEGRQVFVVLGHPDGAVIYTTPSDWETPLTTEQILAKTVSRRELAAWITSTTFGSPS